MNLSTTYLGFNLRSPIVPSASPLSEDLENIKRMEQHGAAAIVLHSLFEEQIRQEREALYRDMNCGVESFAEALTYFPQPESFHLGPEAYLKHLERAKSSVTIPIIASINCSTLSGWVGFANSLETAGADAIELNIYRIPTELDLPGVMIEEQCIELFRAVRERVNIPLAVKLSPFFTNFANIAKRLADAGANGLVLFNRFYQPDIELESLNVSPNVMYSTPMAMRLPLRWIAILYDRISASLAATSGIHRGTDVLKMLMAGADATMVCSAILRHGISHIQTIEDQMRTWMYEHDYDSVEQLKGSLSHKYCPDPSAFERAQYIRALGSMAH